MEKAVFEWDEAKALSNVEKHGVSFEEASTIFNDVKSYRYFDVKHSQVEDRWLIVGTSPSGRILVVVYTERGTNIRIISSRKANTNEIKRYENQS
jgi:uncharacterized DUF497 family protein